MDLGRHAPPGTTEWETGMNDISVTMVGNVAGEVRYALTSGGVPRATFRIATTPRRYDRAAASWVDGDTIFMGVTCWRALAEHVASSLSKGDPVLVTGRLRSRTWEQDGVRRHTTEIDALTAGHDLSRGAAAFRRATPEGVATTPAPAPARPPGADPAPAPACAQADP